MYTIKHASEVTGLSPATLRAWERRYGVVTPQRTEAGYRLYDEATFRALKVMAALVAQGWSPAQAADETRRRLDGEADLASSQPTADDVVPPDVDGAAPRVPAGATPPKADLDRALATDLAPDLAPDLSGGTSAEDSDAFVDAAGRLEVVRLGAILDQRFAVASFESVVDGWLMPTLVLLGEGWARGSVSVAGEHLASYTVMRRLATAYDAASAGATGPSVVVGLPPGARHELGVLAFAVAARRAGLRAAYLGADLPVADWITAVTTHRPRAVVLSAMQGPDVPALDAVVAGLRSADPELTIAVGGALQDQAPAGCLRLGHEIGPGAALLRDAVDGHAPASA